MYIKCSFKQYYVTVIIMTFLYSLRVKPPPPPHLTKNSWCAPALQYEMETHQYKFLN